VLYLKTGICATAGGGAVSSFPPIPSSGQARPCAYPSPPEGRLSGDAPAASPVTLEAAEREHILRTLRDTNWVIAGPHGAVARLGMKLTTLQSRMSKLGISRPGRQST